MNEGVEGRVFEVIGEVLFLNDVNLPEILREELAINSRAEAPERPLARRAVRPYPQGRLGGE